MEKLTKYNFKEKLNTALKDDNLKFNYEYISDNVKDTILLAKTFASNLNKTDIIALNGELGAGKTVFVSGIAKYFNMEEQISSPTFTIVNEYCLPSSEKLYHFDVYRIEDSTDFLDSIGTHYFEDGICIIEWAEIIKDILPKRTINININKDNSNENIRYFNIWRN